MTATPSVKEPELHPTGLVDQAGGDSLTDLFTAKLNEKDVITEKEKNDFTNTFICHLIFYAVFCVSLVLYIVIDLGLGSVLEKIYIQLIEAVSNNVFEKKPAFA